MITPEEIFARIWKYFITENRAPVCNKTEPNLYHLQYRFPDGRKDVYGLFIRDEKYTPAIERQQIQAIIPLLDFVTEDDLRNPNSGLQQAINILINCAQAHDHAIFYNEDSSKQFKKYLLDIAAAHGFKDYPKDPPDHSESAPVEETELSN